MLVRIAQGRMRHVLGGAASNSQVKTPKKRIYIVYTKIYDHPMSDQENDNSDLIPYPPLGEGVVIAMTPLPEAFQEIPADDYEVELLAAFNAGAVLVGEDLATDLHKQQKAGQKKPVLPKFKKDKPISIRLSATLIERLKDRANQQGIPYQTLVSSILHQYAFRK